MLREHLGLFTDPRFLGSPHLLRPFPVQFIEIQERISGAAPHIRPLFRCFVFAGISLENCVFCASEQLRHVRLWLCPSDVSRKCLFFCQFALCAVYFSVGWQGYKICLICLP